MPGRLDSPHASQIISGHYRPNTVRMGRVTRCTNCGAENESGAVFCVACGHFLEWTDPQPVQKQPPPA